MFDHILGQEHAVEQLQRALRSRQISHAYLITGEEGSGKQLLATAFARTILCEHPAEKDGILLPCETCSACHRTAALTHPDFVVLQHEKADTVSVEEIRALRTQTMVKAYEAANKIFVLPEADKMTPQAQNALLKTLEEPPGETILLLLAQAPDRFLPTVRSRCVTIALRPVAEQRIAALLEERGEGREAELLAALSGGNPGKAIAYAEDEDFMRFLGRTLDLLRALPRCSASQILAYLREEITGEKASQTPEVLLHLLRVWLRDVTLLKRTGSAPALILRRDIQYIKECADALSYKGIAHILQAMQTASMRLSARGNAELILELLLLDIRGSYRKERRQER